MRASSFLMLTLWASPLLAQGYFVNADSPSSPVCPQMSIQNDPSLTRGEVGARMDVVRTYQIGTTFLPNDRRPDLSRVTIYDEKKKATSVGSLKGSLVVIGLWSYKCQPSAKMLMEMAKAMKVKDRYRLAFMPMNYDANRLTEDSTSLGGWNAIHRFLTDNRSYFDENPLPMGIPGIGDENPGHFLGEVDSLPVLMVVDRTGHLASVDIGYKQGMVGQRLSWLLKQEQGQKVDPK